MPILKHSFSNIKPTTNELAVGELALSLYFDEVTQKNVGILYTKTLEGNVIEIGKGVTKLEELEDVDLTNLQEGSFIIREGDKFIATNFIGSIASLVDVELENVEVGDYLRYNTSYESFKNYSPSYSFYELTDVDVPDVSGSSAMSGYNNQSVYYDHTSGKYKLRPRLNTLDQLDDVELTEETTYQILSLDEDNVWRNKPLQIVHDTNPTLGNNLNCNGYSLLNSTYKLNKLVADEPTKTFNYSDGDYWVIEGVDVATNPQCIITPIFNLGVDTTAVMMLEIKQSTGVILLGGLDNIKYEDGKPIQLSGNGKTDLLTITVTKVSDDSELGYTITTYLTLSALNLALMGEGGNLAPRYDKYRYPAIQVFDTPNLYDSYYEYVLLLLNFEEEPVSGKLWYEDKSLYDNPVVTNTTQKQIPIYTLGIQEYVAEFQLESNYITITPTDDIILDGNFTLEFYLNHPNKSEYYTTTEQDHILFSNIEDTLKVEYLGLINSTQTTALKITVGTNEYIYPNAYLYFNDKANKYIHIALVRSSTTVQLYIEGILQNPILTSLDDPITELTLSEISITQFLGLYNSLRLSNVARYTENFNVPNMRLGLVGGANDILDAQVFDIYGQLDRELEYEIFC